MAKAAAQFKFDPKADWPGAWKLLKPAYNAVLVNRAFLILFVGIFTAISLVDAIINKTAGFSVTGLMGGSTTNTGATTLLMFAQLVAYIVLLPASLFYQLQTARNISSDPQQTITRGLGKVLPLIVLLIISVAAVVGGLVLLIIPGVIIALRAIFAEYLIIDKNLGPWKSFVTSFKIAKGNVTKVLSYVVVGIGVSIVASLTSIIHPVVGTAITNVSSLVLGVIGAWLYLWVDAHATSED
jgi:hypothetical protein